MLDWVRLLARVPGTLVDGRSPSLAWVCAVYGCLYLRVYHRNLIPTLGSNQIRIPHCYKLLALVLVLWWAVPMIVNWLCASAVVILLMDPADLFRPAFQLSFVAVLAVSQSVTQTTPPP